MYVRPADALAVIPQLPFIYCEPFSDSSQIPTFLVSQLARQQVTVALSGDGGDELFGGYNRYLMAHKLWRKIQRLPSLLRYIIINLFRTFSPNTWDKLFDIIKRLLPNRMHLSNLGYKAHKLADVLAISDEKKFLSLPS